MKANELIEIMTEVRPGEYHLKIDSEVENRYAKVFYTKKFPATVTIFVMEEFPGDEFDSTVNQSNFRICDVRNIQSMAKIAVRNSGGWIDPGAESLDHIDNVAKAQAGMEDVVVNALAEFDMWNDGCLRVAEI